MLRIPFIKLIKLFLLHFLLLITLNISAQVIPPSRSHEWFRSGCVFTFPSADTLLNVMDFGAVADGVTNDQPAIQNAINALSGTYRKVYLPAGTYRLSASISLSDSVILCGAGSDSTFLKLDHSSTGINVNGGGPASFAAIIWGDDRDSRKIRVNMPGLFAAGNWAEIREENGLWDSNPATWATYSVGQIILIDSVKEDTLFLGDELRISYDSSLNPQIGVFTPRKACSIECLNFDRTDGNIAGTGYNVQFNFAVNCRMIGVESNKSQGSHCMIGQSAHVSISGCYFHDSFVYDGSGTKGYGVTLNNHAGPCLISNNIFEHLRHAMMTKHGANGNVFAYNYSRDPFRNGQFEFPQDYCGDISLHGHYSYANLFEGNIVQTIFIDQTWGPSGPDNSFFRNRVELYGLIMTSTATEMQNFAGNEITGTGFTFPFNHGQYLLTGNNHLEYGNNDNGSIIPSGTGNLTDSTYYLIQKPVFWPVSVWPSIGPPNNFGVGNIPAYDRYLASQFTDCSAPEIITKIENNANSLERVSVFPNPFHDCIYINGGEIIGETSIRLFDLMGRLITYQHFNIVKPNELLFFKVSENLHCGLFLLIVENKNASIRFSVIKK